jgi:hypothetical protein
MYTLGHKEADPELLPEAFYAPEIRERSGEIPHGDGSSLVVVGIWGNGAHLEKAATPQ